jgi:hypothetical protein
VTALTVTGAMLLLLQPVHLSDSSLSAVCRCPPRRTADLVPVSVLFSAVTFRPV